MENTAEIQQNEIKPSKKRGFWGWCVVFIRGMFILLFAVILLGGLYFKAPWKILVLDAILLALLTVVPKKKRKFGWLTLGIAVLAVTVWIFIPEKDTGNWRPYTFDKEVRSYNAKYAVPDEENAAVILEEISLKYDDTFYRWPDLSGIDFSDPNFVHNYMEQFELRGAEFYPACWNHELDELTLQNPWKSEDYPEIALWIKEHNNDIDAMIKASHRQDCQFNYTFNTFWFTFNDNPSYAISKWIELLRRAANNDWGDGRIDKSIEKYTAIFRLLHLFSEQPSWGLALSERLQYRVMSDILGRFIIENKLNEHQLHTLERAVVYREHDLKLLFEKWFEYEKLCLIQNFGTLYETNDKGQIRLARVTHNPLLKNMNIEIPKRRFEKQRAKLEFVLTWFYFPTTPQSLSNQIDSVYDRIYDMPLSKFAKEIEIREFQMNYQSFFIIPLLNSHLKVCHMAYQTKENPKLYQNAYYIYIGLSRYRNQYDCWPDGLDQLSEFTVEDVLIDPLNEGGFVYRKNGDDFTLYSKGKNGIDDQGIYERPVYDPNIMTKDEYYKLEPELDDIQLWPVDEEDGD